MVPVAEADALNEALKKAGATVQYLRLESDHGFSDPPSHRKLALETQTFFFNYLASASAPLPRHNLACPLLRAANIKGDARGVLKTRVR